MLTKDVLDYYNKQEPTVIRNNRRGPPIGAVRKTAIALGCTMQNIYYWGDTVPELVAYKIHYLTNGEVKL